MAGVRLDYRLEDKQVINALKRMEAFNARPMFDEIGGYLDSSVTQRFKDGVGPDGIAWEESERAKNEGGKTLVDFGHLRDSVTSFIYLDGSGLEHGSDMVYAAIQQFGGKAGRNKSVELVERPFIGIDADDEDEINAIVGDFVQQVMPQ